jgi:hypothetical protein
MRPTPQPSSNTRSPGAKSSAARACAAEKAPVRRRVRSSWLPSTATIAPVGVLALSFQKDL